MSLFDRYPEAQRVIVNTRTEKAFRGLLWRKRREYLVLRNAEMLRERGAATPIDGEVVIERGNIDFIQVV